MVRSRLTRDDYDEFLLHAYFGYGRDYLWLCIDRAYRDFNRTMRGFRQLEKKQEAHKQARTHVRQLLLDFPTLQVTANAEYDRWHRQACASLAVVYKEYGYEPFYVGQAQKWLNMSIKYIYTMGTKRIPGFDAFYPLCHVPFDNILIERLHQYGFSLPSTRWSRIQDYEQYLSYQQWIRDRFRVPPLDVEFLLWNGEIDRLKVLAES